MKTSTVVLMSIGLFVLFQEAQTLTVNQFWDIYFTNASYVENYKFESVLKDQKFITVDNQTGRMEVLYEVYKYPSGDSNGRVELHNLVEFEEKNTSNDLIVWIHDQNSPPLKITNQRSRPGFLRKLFNA